MSQSRKKYCAPPTQSSIDDGVDATTEASSSTISPQLRHQSSATSVPTMTSSSQSKMPYRGDSSQSFNSVPGKVNESASTSMASVGNQPVSANTKSPLTNYASDRPFPCTFPECKKLFKTKKDLIKHKITDDEGHDYCKVCDLDFKDDESLHLHKVGSERHVCCPVCSEDFKSEGGRDRHFTQMHAAQQNINCRGCGKHFFKGAALMNHIENNQCPLIGEGDFETQRAIVANNMQKISNEEADDFGLMSLRLSTVGNSSVGGVPIANSILDNEEAPEELDMNMPSLSRIFSNSSSATSTASVIRTKAYQHNYPTLGSDPVSKGKKKAKSTAGSINASEGNPVAESWAKQHFPSAPRTPAPANWNPGMSPDSPYDNTIDAANGRPGHFRMMDLKRDNVDGNYHCPFDNCPIGVYPTFELIQHHLNSGFHRGVDNRCVACLRVFKSPSALTAHMESSSARCQVRDSRQFGNALSLVSGGYLGINGRHADGSIKIDTPEVPVPYTPMW